MTADTDPIQDLGLFNLTAALELLKRERHWHYVNDRKGCRNRRAKSFFICSDVPLPVPAVAEGQYFPGHVLVETNYVGAVKTVQRLLENFDKRGATVRIKASGHCIFIGGH